MMRIGRLSHFRSCKPPLSISHLKEGTIDRVFISELANRPEDASSVRAIVSLAHSLRLKVVAEGVETPAQLEFLKAIGCDEYQGYHFSRPLPQNEFEQLIREQAPDTRPFSQEDAMRTHSKLAAYRRK
jgi:predicted signal transduction protein with EAL and GGDEF domain